MIEPKVAPASLNSSETVTRKKGKKHIKLVEVTYQNNTNSDYTEKIEKLDKDFDYSSNSNYYWGPSELSMLYGTPLYEEASDSQKLALNHLFWVGQYNHTAATEANTVLYNQVTKGVFSHLSGYETLCKMLDFETEQEHSHIHAFQKIGYKTKLSLLGKKALGNPLPKKSDKSTQHNLASRITSQSLPKLFSIEAWQDQSFRLLTKMMLPKQVSHYSTYLQDKEQGSKVIPGTSGGLGGLVAQGSLQKFFTLNWGSSTFLASQYYVIRMIGNMSLKNYEHSYFKYFKQLTKRDEFIPAPTAVSYYHLLDESFHTTTSQLIAQELHKDFPQPTAYEKLVANLTVYMAQKGVLGGLSGVMPTVFRSDAYFLLLLYRMLKSPLFNMSDPEALQWMNKCLCQEHEGFHLNLKFHQRLLSEMRRFFEPLNYLWKVNRDMNFMATGGSIDKALQNNRKVFRQFSSSIA